MLSKNYVEYIYCVNQLVTLRFEITSTHDVSDMAHNL